MRRLQVHPELWRGAEIAGQAVGGVGCDIALFIDDFRDARDRHVEIAGELVDGNAKGLQEVLAQDVARVCLNPHIWPPDSLSLVVINNLDILGTVIPNKTDPPLIIDAY